jgi:hypothetical protein
MSNNKKGGAEGELLSSSPKRAQRAQNGSAGTPNKKNTDATSHTRKYNKKRGEGGSEEDSSKTTAKGVAKAISSKQIAAIKETTTTPSSTNSISVVPDITSMTASVSVVPQGEKTKITASKRKMKSTAKNKEAKRTKSTAAVNVEKVQQMQHELLQLKEQNKNLQNEQVEIAKKVVSKKATNKTVLDDDKTSLEDMAVDYAEPETYSVKPFIGHLISLREGKGPPTITLKVTRKGVG